MNQQIGIYIRDILKELPYNPIVGGIVRPVTIRVMDESNREVATTKPVAMEIDPANCDNDQLHLLSPDDSKSCVMYLEDGGTLFERQDGKLSYWNATMDLIGWINIKKFNTAEYTLSGPVVLSVIEKLAANNAGSIGVFQHIKIKPGAIKPKHPSIFAQYTFNSEKQYLFYPFDFFSLQLQITFVIPARCADDLILSDNVCQ